MEVDDRVGYWLAGYIACEVYLGQSMSAEVVIEYPAETWQGDLAGALDKLPKLKKLYVRAGGDDGYPWDLSTLVKACSLMEFYGMRINDLAPYMGEPPACWKSQLVTFLDEFGHKVTGWRNLKELKISLPSGRTYEYEYLWEVNDLYRILTLDYTANLNLQTIRLEPHRGRPTAGRRNTKPKELLFCLNRELGVFERVLG